MSALIPSIISSNSAPAYEALRAFLDTVGTYRVEEKKTSLHIVAGRAAFLGVHPRKDGIRLNIVLGSAQESPRFVKREQVSSKSVHHELDLKSGDPIDEELAGWIRAAYSRVLV